MCRIFGLLDLLLREEELHNLGQDTARLLHHGGPDGLAHCVFNGVLIGGTRLAISDPESGWQPFTAEGVTVFYSGEIYNAPELRHRLAAEGAQFNTRCDGEVLAPLLARHGANAARFLDGMFAIAAYEHETRRLILLRDQAGLKPLYFFSENGRFGFASEIPALLRLRARGHRLDVDALDRYMRFKAVYGAALDTGAPGDPSLIEGVFSLPPGYALEVRPGEIPAVTETVMISEAELDDPVEDLAALLPGLVAEMLPSDVPYCTVLSGGLDSSVVTTLAARAAGPLHAFTVVPKNPSAWSELPFAQLVAKTTGSKLEQVPIGGSDLPELLPAVVRMLGQPNSDPIIASTFRLFEAIHAAGFPVALTGDASDELFGGYDRFRAVAQTGDIVAYQNALSGMPPGLRERLYTEDTRRMLRVCRRPDDGPWVSPLLPEVTAAKSVVQFELRHRLPVYHLQRLDHLSAAHSVEARVPFCRNGVMSLGRRLRLADKLGSDGAVKITLSAAAIRHGWAPEAIAHRPKQPFTFRLCDNLLEDRGATFDWVREVLTDPGAQRGWFDGHQVEKLLVKFEESPAESTAHAIWALLVLELWLRELGR